LLIKAAMKSFYSPDLCLDHHWKWIWSFCPRLFTSQRTSTWLYWQVEVMRKLELPRWYGPKQADPDEVFTQCLVAFFWIWASTNNCL